MTTLATLLIGPGSVPERVLRIVFDTNVVVSQLIFGRRVLWLRDSWVQGVVTPLVCRETVADLLRVLSYKRFRLGAAERADLLADYLPFAEIVILPDPSPTLPVVCRDRDDAVFLCLAIAGEADALVSGDKDLTVLAEAYPVISVATLRHRLVPRETGSDSLER